MYDQETWRAICEAAGTGRQLYVPIGEYPDEDALAIIDAAVEQSGIDRAELCFEFGRFIVPPLVDTYGVHIDDDWTALDLLENVETHIHDVLRSKHHSSNFDPPEVDATRIDDDRVLLHYESDRQLCDVAKGIVAGVSEFYDEPLTSTERRCMHNGAPHCEITVVKD